jgi:hypothetical protein
MPEISKSGFNKRAPRTLRNLSNIWIIAYNFIYFLNKYLNEKSEEFIQLSIKQTLKSNIFFMLFQFDETKLKISFWFTFSEKSCNNKDCFYIYTFHVIHLLSLHEARFHFYYFVFGKACSTILWKKL